MEGSVETATIVEMDYLQKIRMIKWTERDTKSMTLKSLNLAKEDSLG